MIYTQLVKLVHPERPPAPLRNHSPANELARTRRDVQFRSLADPRVHNRLTHMKNGASAYRSNTQLSASVSFGERYTASRL